MPQDDLVGIKLLSGLRNVVYGVWRSRCCGDEIVLYRGTIFPVCHRHRDAMTEWVLISTDLLTKPDIAGIEIRKETGRVDSVHLSHARLQLLSAGDSISSEAECAHITDCRQCRLALERFGLEYRAGRKSPKSA
jgi:hypothetical protein